MQRIIITSSTAAVALPLSKPAVFSEQNWNLNVIKEVQEMGIKTPSYTTYCASKVLLVAEKVGLLNFLSFSLPLTCFFQPAAWFLSGMSVHIMNSTHVFVEE